MSSIAGPAAERSPVFVTPPAPRWARLAAHAVPLVALPSTLWRLALMLGVPVGYSDHVLRTDYGIPGWGYLYLTALCLLQEGAALLTLGLIDDWGLVVPRWIPLVGGKPVAPLAAVIPAATGALILTVVSLSQLVLWNQVADRGHLSAGHRSVMGWCYAPLLLWGPLLALVTASYWLRVRSRRGGAD